MSPNKLVTHTIEDGLTTQVLRQLEAQRLKHPLPPQQDSGGGSTLGGEQWGAELWAVSQPPSMNRVIRLLFYIGYSWAQTSLDVMVHHVLVKYMICSHTQLSGL